MCWGLNGAMQAVPPNGNAYLDIAAGAYRLRVRRGTCSCTHRRSRPSSCSTSDTRTCNDIGRVRWTNTLRQSQRHPAAASSHRWRAHAAMAQARASGCPGTSWRCLDRRPRSRQRPTAKDAMSQPPCHHCSMSESLRAGSSDCQDFPQHAVALPPPSGYNPSPTQAQEQSIHEKLQWRRHSAMSC